MSDHKCYVYFKRNKSGSMYGPKGHMFPLKIIVFYIYLLVYIHLRYHKIRMLFLYKGFRIQNLDSMPIKHQQMTTKVTFGLIEQNV